MVASRNGHQQVVELLLKEKADPNIQHNDGQTTLMVTSQSGHQEVAELILKEKADPIIQDNDSLKLTMKRLVNEDKQSNEMSYTIGSESLSMQEGRISAIKSKLSDSIRNPFSSFKKQKRKKKFLPKNRTMKKTNF